MVVLIRMSQVCQVLQLSFSLPAARLTLNKINAILRHHQALQPELWYRAACPRSLSLMAVEPRPWSALMTLSKSHYTPLMKSGRLDRATIYAFKSPVTHSGRCGVSSNE